MAKQPKTYTLDELLQAAQAARAVADEANAAAAAADATDEVKAKALALSQAADEAEGAYNVAKQHADAKAAEEAAAAADPVKSSAAEPKPEPEAAAEPQDDPAYVPVLLDENGDRIPRNSLIRLITTTGRNLRALDGELITPEPVAELKGPDVRRGDWYTVQFEAGLIAVDSVKKLR